MARRSTLRFVLSACAVSALVATLCARLVFATTIVSLIDSPRDRIVLAADGLMMGNGVKLGRDRVCKISVIRDCAFTMSGLVFAQSGAKTGLDVPALARVACAGPGSLQQRADTFLSIAHDSVARAVRSLRARHPAVFRQITHGDVFDVFFAGASGGRLMIFSRGFRANTDGAISPEKDESQSHHDLPTIEVMLAGSREHIVAYLQKHPDWANRMDTALAARVFVQLEIDAKSKAVGPPISILEIERDKMCWLARGECKSDRCDDCGTRGRGTHPHAVWRVELPIPSRGP